MPDDSQSAQADHLKAKQLEIDALNQKLASMELELGTFRHNNERARKNRRSAADFVWRVLAGPNLNEALARVLTGLKAGRVEVRDVADTTAAIFGRFVRVGIIGVAVALLPTLLLVWQNTLIADQNRYLVGQARLQEDRAKLRSLNVAYQSLLEALLEYQICIGGPKERQRQWASLAGTKIGWETTCESLLLEMPKDALTDADFAIYFPDLQNQIYRVWSAHGDHKNAVTLAADYYKALLQVGLDRESFRHSHGYARVVIGESVVPGASRDGSTPQADSSSTK